MAKIYLAVGSVTKTAASVADKVAGYLTDQGHQAVTDSAASVDRLNSGDWDAILIITSTTGQGDIPSNLVPFYVELEAQFPLQNQRPFGVISLGDSSYERTFCNAGVLFEERFYELQGHAPVPRITLDASETRTPEVDALRWAEEWLTAINH